MGSQKVRHLVAAINLTPTFKYGEFSLTSFRCRTSGFGACGTKNRKMSFSMHFLLGKIGIPKF
jgi:hypothetical protein